MQRTEGPKADDGQCALIKKNIKFSSYIRKTFLIYDFATLNFLVYEENFLLFFISVPAGTISVN